MEFFDLIVDGEGNPLVADATMRAKKKIAESKGVFDFSERAELAIKKIMSGRPHMDEAGPILDELVGPLSDGWIKNGIWSVEEERQRGIHEYAVMIKNIAGCSYRDAVIGILKDKKWMEQNEKRAKDSL